MLPGQASQTLLIASIMRARHQLLDTPLILKDTVVLNLVPEARDPGAADAPKVAKFAKIGLVPGQDFDASKLNADFVKRVPEIAFDRIMLQFKVNKYVKDIDGWSFFTKTGLYGTDYLLRAFCTAIGLDANRTQDAGYPTSQRMPMAGRMTVPTNTSCTLQKAVLPPVHGFWSLTMYDSNYFFVANPINRYSISLRQNLKHNADGSVDLYIQKESPGADKESNWLPAPAGKFILMRRMYWPDEKSPSIISGSWEPPPVRKVS